ncbi:MAG: transcription-repair coupling factor [Flavobacteriales bacterium TMED191]|nr:MAG: transcription-repair coupling factor [Flavobacteriales bacterium TMED191]
MSQFNLLKLFSQDESFLKLDSWLKEKNKKKIHLKNLQGSQLSIIAANLIKKKQANNLFILDSLESALYFLDDLNNLNPKFAAFLYPSSKRIKKNNDKNIILERISVLKQLSLKNYTSVVTYPEAIFEKILTKKDFTKKKLTLKKGDKISTNNFFEELNSLNFNNTDFVMAPGDYAVRGLIIDVFSYDNDNPYRIVLDDDIIEEITCFNVSSQMSLDVIKQIDIFSNIQESNSKDSTSFLTYLGSGTTIWINNPNLILQKELQQNDIKLEELQQYLSENYCIYTGNIIDSNYQNTIKFNSNAQSSFNQKFEILINHLDEYKKSGYNNIITVSSENQMKRLLNIFQNYLHLVDLVKCENSLKEGFIDHDNKVLIYTDHQIFERHHQYKSKRIYKTNNTSSIRDITNLKKGDYITHFDYGVGQFDGLRIKTQNNTKQESIRILYKNGDVLYISIHALHKISKFKESEFDVKLDKLGSPRWKKLKDKVKSKIKTVAFDLIKLYAKRKITKGFAFSKDTYLQHELEASFIFQETADQITITNEIKKDMENNAPMDRLVCGDVGFGKTEIAIRAAFKAVADNKQVAVLVPTTILALQHNNTFNKRLKNFPCNIKYLNRFVSKKQTLNILDELKEGLVDIIIGTHRLISKDVIFKDLGLLIIDEEQKFGVSTKDKLKTFKENVDTLTLTATPIPRTLQFSLMGSRDLSIMTTYPKNRNPIETTISAFNHETIKEMISYEVSRGGQVFFVHNRVANIEDVHNMISIMHPNLNIRFAHGQMDSKKLETTILNFINGEFDVLITTTIIENGLDIPNANTIIINDAQNFGLADLHQMRGRVGRSNKKAFCYLLTPPFNKIKDNSIKKLNAVSNLSNLGDGFNIAMKDLEIRGAGNMLGAEQSGFIEEMGFTNYQKILNEAVTELKESKFKKASLNIASQGLVMCLIETDLELLIPNFYIDSVTERMNLYKRISQLTDDNEIHTLEIELKDRFGQIPQPTVDLLQSIKLRILADRGNCIKIILKQGKMIVTFNDQLQQDVLQKIINLIQTSKTDNYSVKESNNNIKVYINNIYDINSALKTMRKFI